MQKGKHSAILTIKIADILDILTGHATIKIPPAIPLDSAYLYSWIDPEKQLIKIVIEHENLGVNMPGSYIQEYIPSIEHVKEEAKEEETPSSKLNTLIDDNYSRSI